MNRREAIKTSAICLAGAILPPMSLLANCLPKVSKNNKSFSGFQIFDDYLGGPIEPGQRICVAYHPQDKELALHIFDTLGKNCFNICPKAEACVLDQIHNEKLCPKEEITSFFEEDIIISIKQYPLGTLFSKEGMIYFALPHDHIRTKTQINFFKFGFDYPEYYEVEPCYEIGELNV